MCFPIVRDAMRYKPENCVTVILATMTMHNFLINTGNGYIEDVGSLTFEETGEEIYEATDDLAGLVTAG